MKRQQRKARDPRTTERKKARYKKRRAKLDAAVKERTQYLAKELVIMRQAIKLAAQEIANLRKKVQTDGV